MDKTNYSQEMLLALMKIFLKKYIIQNEEFLMKLRENKIDINTIPEIFEIVHNCELHDFQKIFIQNKVLLIKLTYNYDYINKFSEWNNLEFDEVE
jgi:hypothetical protein